LEQGDLIFAVMASISLPLYFPPLFLDGEQIVDGGVTNNIPLDVAVRKGATKVYAMLCGCQEEMRRPVNGFFNLQSRAFNIATQQKYYWDMEQLKDKAELIVLAPCLTFAGGVLDFSQSEKIMEEAYQYARSVLPAQIERRG
ncbi:MAG: patatin-like phospholipase family protein, partial [Elusimicrobia bacterium]|nr:patatin-like phospholipase family protein [Elusimicrobiota bacterium]